MTTRVRNYPTFMSDSSAPYGVVLARTTDGFERRVPDPRYLPIPFICLSNNTRLPSGVVILALTPGQAFIVAKADDMKSTTNSELGATSIS
jgi:hypothetical protein